MAGASVAQYRKSKGEVFFSPLLGPVILDVSAHGDPDGSRLGNLSTVGGGVALTGTSVGATMTFACTSLGEASARI
jgi:hypothetical protein